MRLDHVQLAIPPGSEDRVRAFWCDLLGLAESEKPEALKSRGGLWLRRGAAELHLGVEAPFAPAKKAHPAFAVPDIDALAETLDRAGHPLRWATDIPGRRRVFTVDPFGNRLEFLAGA